MKKIAALIGLTLSLQGCVFVVGAAAGAAAIAMVYDHRSISNSVQDTRIATKVAEKLHRVPRLKDSHVDVSVFNHVVLLTGQTPNANAKQIAEDVAKTVPEVGRVYNQITIEGPTSSLTRTSDSWITTKIKTQMLATDDLKSSSIKIITENGVVYLMGVVSEQQAEIAVDIARQVSGVQKVVKIFQYKKPTI